MVQVAAVLQSHLTYHANGRGGGGRLDGSILHKVKSTCLRSVLSCDVLGDRRSFSSIAPLGYNTMGYAPFVRSQLASQN